MNFPVLSPARRLALLEPPTGRVRMVLDTDTYNEIDDQFALVYALLSPERLDVEALYAAPFHNERSTGPEDGMRKSYDEIVRVLTRLGRSQDGFVFHGSPTYLPAADTPVASDAVADLITRARAEREVPLYVVAIGAITNIASALLTAPDILDRIVVVWLGGHPPYWPHTQEFNLMQDVAAAQVIFDSGVPLVQVPCMTVTEQLRISRPEMEQFVRPQGAIGEYLFEIFAEATQNHPTRTRPIWDIGPLIWLTNPEWITSALIHSPILTREKTWSHSPYRHFIREVYAINRDATFEEFFRKLGSYERGGGAFARS